MPTKKRLDPAALRSQPWIDDASECRLQTPRGPVTVPARFRALMSHPEWDGDVELTVVIHEDTGPVARQLGMAPNAPASLNYRHAHELLASVLSPRYDLGRLLQDLTVEAVAFNTAGALSGLGLDVGDSGMRVKNAMERARDATSPRPRRRGITTALLQEVADTYRAAMAAGNAPTAAVAQHFVVSHSTATRWVGQARKAKKLGPARGTRPGEKGKGR